MPWDFGFAISMANVPFIVSSKPQFVASKKAHCLFSICLPVPGSRHRSVNLHQPNVTGSLVFTFVWPVIVPIIYNPLTGRAVVIGTAEMEIAALFPGNAGHQTWGSTPAVQIYQGRGDVRFRNLHPCDRRCVAGSYRLPPNRCGGSDL